MAVQITHIHSNESRTHVEPTRILFECVRLAFVSPRTPRVDLSRRLRDGVSLALSLSRYSSLVCHVSFLLTSR